MTGLRERRRAELRRHVDGVALELFARDGYDAVTMDDVAAAAGISLSTLFRHVPGKEDLLVGVARVGRRLIVDTFAEHADAEPAAGLAAAILRRTARLADETELVEVWRGAMASAPPRVRRASLLDDAERLELVELVAARLGADAAVDVRPGALVAAHLAAAEHAYEHWLLRAPSVGLHELTRQALGSL